MKSFTEEITLQIGRENVRKAYAADGVLVGFGGEPSSNRANINKMKQNIFGQAVG
jgi:hypothetical protein